MTTPWLVDRPLQVGPHTLPSRIYLPAHQPGLADGGRPGDRYIAYHRARARSGVAMQVTGATPILPSSEWSDICLWNVDESIVPGYQRLAAAVHEEGGRILAQLAHPGPTETEGPDVIGASWDFSEVSRQVAVPATAAELNHIIDLYAAAADRCRRGELDGVEISMAHGLLLATFISPLTNHRDDEFGGSFERRLTLALNVIDAVRASISAEMMLGIRLGADDLVDGGLDPQEAARVAQALESRVDYISVMVGNNNRFEARVRHWPPTPAEHGLFRTVARTIKAVVSVPVLAVGRVTDVALANDILAAGDADMVGMVRAQIADPELLAKTRAGRAADVRPCVGVNLCVNGLLAGRPLSCLVNPDVGHEGDAAGPRVTEGQHAVVIGAGPGGLEASRRLALAGYQVTLLEASERLGGQLATWSMAPSRAEVGDYVSWQARQLAVLGVRLETGQQVDASSVAEHEPDIVVVATGSRPARLKLSSQDGSVQTKDPLLALEEGAQGDVVVFDGVGELDGALIAERLATSGSGNVTLATSRLHVGEGDGINTLYPMIRRLAELGVTVVERVRPTRAERGTVLLEGVFGEPSRRVPADVLVPWWGGVPVNDIAEGLRASGTQTVKIGDARRPRRAVHAIHDAKQAVDRIQALS